MIKKGLRGIEPVIQLVDILFSVLLSAVCNLEFLHEDVDLLLKEADN